MKKFDKNFNFNDSYIKLSNLELVDPSTVQRLDNSQLLIMNKQTCKTINFNYGMRSYQFSKQLYDQDSELWTALRNKKKSDSGIKDYKDNHFAVVIDDMIVSVMNNNENLEKVLEILNSYTEHPEYEYLYEYDADEFRFLVLKDYKDGKVGFMIDYYLSYNWITITYVYLKDTDIYFTTSPICDKEIEDDLHIILDYDVLTSGIMDEILEFEYNDFKDKSSSTQISFEELFNYLKHDIGANLSSSRFEPDGFLLLLEANDNFSESNIEFIKKILTETYESNYKFIHASYIKKSINFTEYSFYEYYKFLSDLYLRSGYNKNSIIDIIRSVVNNKANYFQISK